MVNQWNDDRLDLKQWLRNYSGFIIHFNGVKYDMAVLAYLDMKNYYIGQSWDVFCREAKRFSDQLITTEDDLFVYKYTDYPVFKNIIQIDTYLFWAKLLRLSMKISLKSLGIQLNYPVVQELPYPPDIQELTEEQIDEIHHYCSVHDLGILRLLTQQLEGNDGQTTVPLGDIGTIQLRSQIVKDYNINAWSYDPPKIASEALLNDYCRITGKDRKYVSKQRFDRPTIKFGDLFKDVQFNFQTEPFLSVYKEWMNSVDSFSKEFNVYTPSNHGLKISCGIGGLHNILSNEIYSEDNDYAIIDIDISSLYPTFILNFHAFRYTEVEEQYKQIRQFRLTETKPNLQKYKGKPEELYWKQKDLFYKVVLNGVSGHLDSEHSWLYNPEGIMKVRCGGQLVLLTVIEQCLIKDIQVLQANTDGITVRILRSKIPEFEQIVKQSEIDYNIEYEYAYYSKMIFSSVNSYLAIETNGKVKQKGEFVTNPKLGSSVDMLVVPKALNAYFINGIQPEDFIRSKELTIFDFCISQKVSKEFEVFWQGEKQQRLNRYYSSRTGGYLYKKEKYNSWLTRTNKSTAKKKTPPTMQHLMKETGVMIYNNHVEKPMEEYKINYNFYLNKINSKIAELKKLDQQSLF